MVKLLLRPGKDTDYVETSGGRNTQTRNENIMVYINKLEDLLSAFVDQAWLLFALWNGRIVCLSMSVSHVNVVCFPGLTLAIFSRFYEKQPSRSSMVFNLTHCTNCQTTKIIFTSLRIASKLC